MKLVVCHGMYLSIALLISIPSLSLCGLIYRWKKTRVWGRSLSCASFTLFPVAGTSALACVIVLLLLKPSSNTRDCT